MHGFENINACHKISKKIHETSIFSVGKTLQGCHVTNFKMTTMKSFSLFTVLVIYFYDFNINTILIEFSLFEL